MLCRPLPRRAAATSTAPAGCRAHVGRHGSGRRALASRVRRCRRHRLHLLAEAIEKGVGHLLRGGIDQPAAKLRQLAANLGVDLIAQQRVGAIVGQRDVGTALGEPGHTALPFAADAVAVRRIDIGKLHLAGEPGGDRADLDGGGGLHLVVVQFLQALAAGNAGFQHLRVVERLPYGLPRRRNAPLARHVHAKIIPC